MRCELNPLLVLIMVGIVFTVFVTSVASNPQEVHHYWNTSDNIRNFFIGDDIISATLLSSNLVKLYHLNGTLVNSMYFPFGYYALVKAGNSTVGVGDMNTLGFRFYDTLGNTKLTYIPEDGNSTGAIHISDTIAAVGTGGTGACGGNHIYVFEHNLTNVTYKWNYSIPDRANSVYVDDDIMGLVYSNIPSSACTTVQAGLMVFDFEGNLLWNKSYGSFDIGESWVTANAVIIEDDMVVVGGKHLRAYNKSGTLLWSKQDLNTNSVDMENGLIVATAYTDSGLDTVNAYNYSGSLLWSKEVADYFLSNADSGRSVSMTDNAVIAGGSNGVYVFNYSGSQLFFFQPLAYASVYSVHANGNLLGAAFGSYGGLYLFNTDTTTTSSTTTTTSTSTSTTSSSTTTTSTTSSTTITSTTTTSTTTSIPPVATLNQTINCSVNETIEISSSAINASLEIKINTNFTNLNITIYRYNTSIMNASLPAPSLGKYISIDADEQLLDSLEYALLRIFYTEEELNTSGLNETDLAMWRYNETLHVWQILEPNTMNWVHATGVNTTQNHVWCNVTHLSDYAIAQASQTHLTLLVLGWNLISLPLNI